MKNLFSLIIAFVSLIMIKNCSAQPYDIAGVYYLSGVMETASGIKLNPDSTFQFFFSQGALDRTGEGTWKVKNDEIILNSADNAGKGFEIIESKKIKQKGSIIEVFSESEMLLTYLHSSVSGTDQKDFINSDETGKMMFENEKIDQIYLYFELCPEKIHELKPVNENDNYIKISLLPEIFNVPFNELKLTIHSGYLSGQHPLMTGKDYRYDKSE